MTQPNHPDFKDRFAHIETMFSSELENLLTDEPERYLELKSQLREECVGIWNDGFEASQRIQHHTDGQMFNWNWSTKCAGLSRKHFHLQNHREWEPGDYYTTEVHDLRLWRIHSFSEVGEITTELLFDDEGNALENPVLSTFLMENWERAVLAPHRIHIPNQFLKVER